jgi:tetratricopeptide (TPR) repeat protein
MDSVLNQMPQQHYNTVQHHYASTQPTFLQPPFQYLGPTASGGQGTGPYGPYWHDGTFVPYRPAAVRDPRFYQHPHGGWLGSLPGSQYASQASLYPSGPSPHGYNIPNGFGAPPKLSSSMYPNHAQHLYAQLGDPSLQGQQPFPNDSMCYSIQSTGFANSSQPYLNRQQFGLQQIQAEFGSASPNGQQRDTTFIWALQQYRELLAYIHHTRRQQQAARQIDGQTHVVQRPTFYPQPPKLSRAGHSFHGNRRTSITIPKDVMEKRFRRSSDPTSGQSISRGTSVEDRDGDDVETPRARSPTTGSLNASQPHGSEKPQGPTMNDYKQGDGNVGITLHHQERPRTLRRSSGSAIQAAMSAPPPQENTPPSRARFALTQITKLCQETGWQWTEGMHLGGCIAYGLGNYQKALKWYSKVLEQDPKHLEALSNLAATMLALGRKQEAEQNWMKVVKAAPSHFEAVEHLIGLLCNDQRSRDAIKVIEYVEANLRNDRSPCLLKTPDKQSDCDSSNASRSPVISEESDRMSFDFDCDTDSVPGWKDSAGASEPGFGSSGFAIPGCDNGRILALIHAKGNMLYGTGDNGGAARAFEDAVLIATGRKYDTIQSLVNHILKVVASNLRHHPNEHHPQVLPLGPILLTPDQALATAKLCFPLFGELPGLQHVPGGPQSTPRKAVISTTSNSLLSLAKIFQDGMSNTSRAVGVTPLASGVRDILALYYLSLSLQPSPSTANNVGILLASVQQVAPATQVSRRFEVPGVVPGSGIALALQYYNYGLLLDQHHAHLYTNLGSLLKDIGQLDAAISMYERAVKCDGKFDIALANLANAVKDKGRISDAITYYKRAVNVSPDFAEAVCGLANALNSVCGWHARGGIANDGGKRDRWHVDHSGMLLDARQPGATSSGWIKRVVDIVEKQLRDGESWGRGTLGLSMLQNVIQQVLVLEGSRPNLKERTESLRMAIQSWAGKNWEGARITRLIERAIRRIGWHWYQDMHVWKRQRPVATYDRPMLPANLSVPTAPTVLPFHTFTTPMSAKQIRLISQRNGLRISVCTLRSPWLPKQVFPPPDPPAPYLRVGYVSSDFNNHPLAHLMQSVFGLHDTSRVKAYCYATTASDKSVHRRQIEKEAPMFWDSSAWTAERLVSQIVSDGIHILVNLNGYTRGARNEVFAARAAPIQMSFMGFAGTLGAEWCDYLLADVTAVPPETLRPWRRNIDLEDQIVDENSGGDNDDWVYGENIIYCRDTFFCCDHRQSAPDAKDNHTSWEEEQSRRWQMRKELFPQLADDTIVFATLQNRTNHFPHLATHPSPRPKRRPMAPPLPRSWGIAPLTHSSTMGDPRSRRPHHLHRRRPETPAHLPRTYLRPRPRHSRVQRPHHCRRRPLERHSLADPPPLRVQNVLPHGGVDPTWRPAQGRRREACCDRAGG